ncbi:transcriptional regulator MerR family [Patulibacter medicamentivorans]|uniref:Transcriptional regulator MerR family n=1 Tax=Patulibacter medicamentivorans TaxID=1097667 RepID=H0E3U8_9ACTN|nr:MerR family DNA-binding transcriptional regulator [Patulibacter medicamentivorans]EHN11647.1 transcriptional regulator MerR family [Patulibacter medicamentivorans]
MTAIRTTAAAELLGVSASTLRSWERRYGFPTPQRTDGGHRQYELGEIDALRDALGRTPDAATAVAIARRGAGAGGNGELDALRGGLRSRTEAGPVDRLRRALRRYDEPDADRVVEESLHLRSLERSVDEVLLPALDGLDREHPGSVEYAFAWRWASRWLAAATRTAPPAHRPHVVVMLDGTAACSLDALRVQALDLALRRAGVLPVTVGADLQPSELSRALGRIDPHALVLSGRGVPLDRLGRLVFAAQRAAGGELPVLDFHGPLLERRTTGVERLDGAPLVARSRLLQVLEGDDAPFRVRRGR